MAQMLRTAVAPSHHGVRQRHSYAALFVLAAVVAGISAPVYGCLSGTSSMIANIGVIYVT
jgi:hypothetical protein